MRYLAFSLSLFFFLYSSGVSADMVYPYTATSERVELIKSQYSKIEIGDSEISVLTKLPKPDEILDLYEPKMHRPNIIGKTYWYIIERDVKTGSVNEKNEKLVRVQFDLKGKVTRVDHWGF